MSWIFHDRALEGVVYTFDELRTALGAQPPPIGDSEPPADLRRHPPPQRGDRVRARLRREEAPARHRRRDQEDLFDPPSARGRSQDGEVSEGRAAAPALLPRVHAARQDRLQGPAGRRLVERAGDAEDAERRAHRGARALRHAPCVPLPHREREGRAALHESAPPPLGLAAVDHPLDRAAALLRGAQGIGDHGAPDGARGRRERPVERREAPRRARDEEARLRQLVKSHGEEGRYKKQAARFPGQS